ncbi:MAG: hypothetical protein H8E46_09665, partial [FCB group bacterium]|nr:hypothetical protein [FCB group bacterium]
MIIALDISLAEFGIAVFDLAGQLVHCECVITKPIKKKLNPRQIDSDHLRVKEIVMRLNSLHAQFGFRGIVAEVPPGGT